MNYELCNVGIMWGVCLLNSVGTVKRRSLDTNLGFWGYRASPGCVLLDFVLPLKYIDFQEP